MTSPPERGTALVTGGARRLGAGFVQAAAERGWRVLIHCHRSGAAAQDLAAELRRRGGQAEVLRTDLGQEGGAEALAEAAGAFRPRLVVHSASAWSVDTPGGLDRGAWEASRRLHVWTALVLARHLALWAGTGGAGHLITVLDAGLDASQDDHYSYTAAKRELAALTPQLARLLAPRVRVNSLAPGRLLAPGRDGMPAGLTEAFLHLLDSPDLTGQTLTIAGGDGTRRARDAR